MDFLTAYYAQKDARGVSLLLQQYEWRGKRLCFACIAEAGVGKAAAYMTEQLLHWLREMTEGPMKGLVKREKNVAVLAERMKKVINRADEELHCSGLMEVGQWVSVAGALCLEDAFITVQRGELRSYLLNTYFGKSCLQELNGHQSGAYGKSLLVEYGILQGDVGLLFATESFCGTVGEKMLKEGLCIAGLQTEEQVEKHLEELSAEGERLGGNGMAAIVVKSTAENWVVKNETKRNEECAMGVPLRITKGKMPKNRQRVAYNQREKSGEDMEVVALNDMFRQRGYMCCGLLGQGAFAAVYKVKEQQTGRIFACKVSGYKELLDNEFQFLKELRHPLFPEVYDYWEVREIGVMRMEYIAGEGLDEMLSRRKHFSVRQIARMGMELAEGLLYLHEGEGTLLFRDIKPENIVVTQSGRVKLLDFGCVCEQENERKTKAGSPGFAAPEQLAGEVTGVTGDVYGLGQTLRTLRGERMRGKGRWLKKHRHPMRRGTERYLDRVLEVCVQEDAEKRLPDMRSVIHALVPLCEEKRGGGFWRKKKSGREWGKLRCRKNIWKSDYKRA